MPVWGAIELESSSRQMLTLILRSSGPLLRAQLHANHVALMLDPDGTNPTLLPSTCLSRFHIQASRLQHHLHVVRASSWPLIPSGHLAWYHVQASTGCLGVADTIWAIRPPLRLHHSCSGTSAGCCCNRSHLALKATRPALVPNTRLMSLPASTLALSPIAIDRSLVQSTLDWLC